MITVEEFLVYCDLEIKENVEFIWNRREKFLKDFLLENRVFFNIDIPHWCRNKYWENKEYIALGIGASFYTEGFRGKNLLGFDDYYKAIDEGKKPWLEAEKVENPKDYEYMLGLRLLQKGIEPTEENIKKTCEKLKNEGYLVEVKKHTYILSKKGLFFGNIVFENFV